MRVKRKKILYTVADGASTPKMEKPTSIVDQIIPRLHENEVNRETEIKGRRLHLLAKLMVCKFCINSLKETLSG